MKCLIIDLINDVWESVQEKGPNVLFYFQRMEKSSTKQFLQTGNQAVYHSATQL